MIIINNYFILFFKKKKSAINIAKFSLYSEKFSLLPTVLPLVFVSPKLFHPNSVLCVFGTVGKFRECRIQK